MRKTLSGLVALVLAVTVVAGCSGSGGTSGTGNGPGNGPGNGSQVIRVTFKGDTVTPNGDRIAVKLGRPVVLRITADKAGEIHVHSTPEQQVSYPAGTSTRRFTIDKPGVVDVESHHLEKTIVQLEVS